MEGQQVDAAPGSCAEALVERAHERADVAVEGLRKPHETREIRLSRLLALAELVGRVRQPAERDRRFADGGGRVALARQGLEEPPRRVTSEKRGALERDRGVVEELLEIRGAGVR